MIRSRTRRRSPLLMVALIGAVLTGCASDGDESAVRTAPNLTCGQDTATDDAKTIVEDVGGLVTDDFTVTFAKGTELGVVALVDKNVPRAFQVLRDDYGVVVVARQKKNGDPGTISGFTQIQQIVDDVCGP